MPRTRQQNSLLLLLSAAMICVGLGLAIWAFSHLPAGARADAATVANPPIDGTAAAAGAAAVTVPGDKATLSRTAETGRGSSTAVAPQPAPLALIDLGDAPMALLAEFEQAGATKKISVTTTVSSDPAVVLSLDPDDGDPLFQSTFAAATRFDTVSPQIAFADVRRSWATPTPTYTQVAVLSDTLPALVQVLGNAGRAVRGHATMTDVVDAAWQDRTTLALVPFDQLNPRLVVLSVDGQNPVENANHFDPTRYPLVATIYGKVAGRDSVQSKLGAQLLSALPSGNRDPGKLTVLAMTGVTAMTRQMAVQMDRFGAGWPAVVVGPELASADITAVSNEVPFVEGCVPNIDPENFNFCSKPEYLQALTDAGVDIIGLTGNHQNDFGRENARQSIALHEDAGLPLYGGGLNLDAAFKPLILEHNGNRLAFLGANSYGPKMAWATDSEPGSAPFDLNIMSATIRNLKEKGLADAVLAELQYQESYDTAPLADQRQDFQALTRAGADIVTGVQSHVPQGMEFLDGRLILYGLGNLYFDQMWDQATREGLIVKHTFYDGRHISTQVLTTLLYDYGQPRWSTPAQRATLLDRVFAASYW